MLKHIRTDFMTSILPVTINNYSNNSLQPKVKPKTQNLSETLSMEKQFPWVMDKNIILALKELSQITFKPEEVAELEKLGVNIPFISGADAVKFLKDSNVRIFFDDMPAEIHAQYDYLKNFVKINSLYKNTVNSAEILAIAEAILHEAGHAKDNDDKSSVQEEINSLGTNALAHRNLQRRYPYLFITSNALIVKDGVQVYEKLFFDTDSDKKALVKRLQVKYGYLPAGDEKHPPTKLANKVKGLSVK